MTPFAPATPPPELATLPYVAELSLGLLAGSAVALVVVLTLLLLTGDDEDLGRVLPGRWRP